MNVDEVLTKLQTVFDDVFLEHVDVRRELSAKDVPEWDSMLHILLIVAVETAFGIQFRVGEVEGTRNVGELAELIQRRCGG